MKHHRIRRELLWLTRYGEFGPDSERHLDHLAGCDACRDEVGYDREMVRQLRIALRERVEGIDPSPSTWEGILRRAQTPEPGRLSSMLRGVGALAARMRTATAMAGTGLALVLALNMEVIPMSVPAAVPTVQDDGPRLEQVPRLPTGRTALVAWARQSNERTVVERTDLEKLMTHVRARAATPVTPATAAVEERPEQDQTATEVRFIVRPLQAPEGGSRDPRRVDHGAGTIRPEAGEPS